MCLWILRLVLLKLAVGLACPAFPGARSSERSRDGQMLAPAAPRVPARLPHVSEDTQSEHTPRPFLTLPAGAQTFGPLYFFLPATTTCERSPAMAAAEWLGERAVREAAWRLCGVSSLARAPWL